MYQYMTCRLRSVGLLFILCSTFLCGTLFAQGPPADWPPRHAPDRVLVSFQPGTAASDIAAAHRGANGKSVKNLAAIGVQVVAVPHGTVEAAVQHYQRNPNVRFAEPNYIYPLFKPTTNEGFDPFLGHNMFVEQWWLENTGQDFGATLDPLTLLLIVPAYKGAADADIDAPEGWALGPETNPVKIAILDSGISCLHVDLDSKCVEQLSFVEEHYPAGDPNALKDVVAHGTHVAGIAAAETNNGIGIAGVSQLASLGSLKVCYEDATLAEFGIIQAFCEEDDIAEAIIHAADNGYQVINMSIAGPTPSIALEDAVNYAWSKGVVLVAGAGNEYGTTKQYPAGYDNVIGVAATDYYDNLASFSTFGNDVSVAAPGHIMLSTVPGALCGVAEDNAEGCYDWKSGTSMATPVVAGVAACLFGTLPPGTSNVEVRNIIESTADQTGALGQNFLAWTQHGKVNLRAALESQSGGGGGGGGGGDTTPPVVSNVNAAKVKGTRFDFTITWNTDEPATSGVDFTCCGFFDETALVTAHSRRFTADGKGTYEYFVVSRDAAGNEARVGPFYHRVR